MVIAGNAVNAYRIVALIVALAFDLFSNADRIWDTGAAAERNRTDKLSLKDMYPDLCQE